MLFANSMSLMWLSYYGLSLIVLIAVYFALAWLPRLPRLVLTWIVAGAMWMPARFRLPLVEEGEFYTGWAPAAMVSAVGVLEGGGSGLRDGLLWLILGMALGACVGIALWWWRRPQNIDEAPQPREVEEEPTRRREPVIN
ncbi:hypothetical protein LG301_05365 [Vreelandella venusta]|uniref:hypothetical protein n=1 Tax=Vreelandella venusta TaxID=44935 RepID=UPI00384A894F